MPRGPRAICLSCDAHELTARAYDPDAALALDHAARDLRELADVLRGHGRRTRQDVAESLARVRDDLRGVASDVLRTSRSGR